MMNHSLVTKVSLGLGLGTVILIGLGFLGDDSNKTPIKPIPVVATSTPTTTPETKSVSVKPSTPDFHPVLKVVDGDTVTISLNGKSETLRLIGINTPETVDPRKPVECFGQEASNKAKALLTGQSIRIELDPTQGERDKYDRLLAYVFLKDGSNFNQVMIEQGYAYEYTYGKPYKYQQAFKTAQAEAKANNRGLWSPEACAVPTPVPVVPTPTPTPRSSAPVSSYTCSANTYNCPDFSSQAEAQNVFELCGGTSNDIHKLDQDGDGEVCESL